ncbi:hypothetical protein D3C75_907950 [compost metagenome]
MPAFNPFPVQPGVTQTHQDNLYFNFLQGPSDPGKLISDPSRISGFFGEWTHHKHITVQPHIVKRGIHGDPVAQIAA